MRHLNATYAGVVHAIEVFEIAMVVHDADDNVETSPSGRPSRLHRRFCERFSSREWQAQSALVSPVGLP